MTNSEKMKEIFPNATTRIYKHKDFTCIVVEQDDKWIADFDVEWWNAEYKEPNKSEIPTGSTTIAQERYQNLIDYFGDKEVAKTILEDRKEFKAWLERLRWHVKRADELARELEQLKGTTKNDLGVDAVSRKAVINQIFYSTDNNGDVVLGSALRERIARLPSVTPQLSSGLEKNSKKLEKDCESDCISRKSVIDELKRYFHDEYYQRTSIQDCRDCFIEDVLNHLPSVTPQPKKGHWIYKKFDEKTGITNVHICSKCGCPLASPYKSFCSACGSDNREVRNDKRGNERKSHSTA